MKHSRYLYIEKWHEKRASARFYWLFGGRWCVWRAWSVISEWEGDNESRSILRQGVPQSGRDLNRAWWLEMRGFLMFVKTIITQRLNGLRAQYALQRTSLWCLHSKDMGEEEVWENGICVCGGVCVRAKNSMVFNELVNGKEEITAACKSLSIYWFPFVLEIKLFYTGCGGWGVGGTKDGYLHNLPYTNIW